MVHDEQWHDGRFDMRIGMLFGVVLSISDNRRDRALGGLGCAEGFGRSGPARTEGLSPGDPKKTVSLIREISKEEFEKKKRDLLLRSAPMAKGLLLGLVRV